MDLSELNELSFDNVGDWPIPVKIAAIVFVCLLFGGAVYYFDTQNQLARLDKVEHEELTLRKDFEKKQEKASNLEGYKRQLEEMRESFGAMLRQLPNKTEVASLLVDVSQTGLANGLEFERFEPKGENRKGFYAELPIQIRVHGTYPDFGKFVSGLASLSRIVTIHNIKIDAGRKAAPAPGDKLTLDATVKTYRYLEEGAQ